MPAPETAYLFEKAVLWAAGGFDQYGQEKVNAPVEINCRWNKKRTQVKDATGATITVDATVVVSREIRPGAVMWEGELEDWYGTGSAHFTDSELMKVVSYDETSDLKMRNVRRQIGLVFFRESLPTLVT